MTTTSTTTSVTGATATVMPPINLMKWVDEHRHLLKPPVGNQYLYESDDFFVMIIGGPNARNDFHITNSPEFFHQVKGDITVRVREGETIRDIPLREGETLFIPGNVPHSPQRPPDTIGRELAALPLVPSPGAKSPMKSLPAGRLAEPLRLASVLSRPEMGIAPQTLVVTLGGGSGGGLGHQVFTRRPSCSQSP